jgi:phosphoglycolate phosphatase
MNSALTTHGLQPRPEEELHTYIGPPLHRTFERLVGAGPLVESCVEAYRDRYRTHAASETLVFDGIRELLERVAESMPVIVATSKPQALAEPVLVALELRPFFRAVVGPGLDAHEPKEVTVARALLEIPEQTRPVLVGDRRFDITAGRAHGLETIGALWGIGSERELREAGADLIERSPASLATLMTLGSKGGGPG